MRYDVPELHVEQPQVPQPPRRPEPQPQLQLSKDDVTGLTGGEPAVEEYEEIEIERPRQQPVRVNKIEPNQRVSVQYSDGRIERDVKYKKVEEDVKRGVCVLID